MQTLRQRRLQRRGRRREQEQERQEQEQQGLRLQPMPAFASFLPLLPSSRSPFRVVHHAHSRPLRTPGRRRCSAPRLVPVALQLPLAALPASQALLAHLNGIPLPTRCATLFLLHILSVTLCFPANLALQIAAGAVLPPVAAFLTMWTSKTLAAVASLLLGRSFLIPLLSSLLPLHHPRWSPLRARLSALAPASKGRAVANSTFSLLLLLRLSPVPGFVLNYLSALANVPLGPYALATAVGVVPSVLNWVLLGATTREGASSLLQMAPDSAAPVPATPLAGALKLAFMAASFVGMLFAMRGFSKTLTALTEGGPPVHDVDLVATAGEQQEEETQQQGDDERSSRIWSWGRRGL